MIRSPRRFTLETMEPRRMMAADVAWIRHDAEPLGRATLIDVDADGDADQVRPVFPNSGVDELYLEMRENLGNGLWSEPIAVSSLIRSPGNLEPNERLVDIVRDLDSDGDADLMVSLFGGFSTYPYMTFLNQGDRLDAERFQFSEVIGGGEWPISDVAVGDLNGNGNDLNGSGNDLAVTGANLAPERDLFIQRHDSAGRRISSLRLATSDAPIYARFVDVDGDRDQDVVWTSIPSPFLPDSRVDLMWSENLDGQGTLHPGRVFANNANPAETPTSLAQGDFNADGWTDIVWTSGANVFFFRGSASGLSTQPTISQGQCSAGLPLDLDADQDLDLFCGSHWFENVDGQGTLVSDNNHGIALPTGWYATTDYDGDGDIDLYGEDWWLENRRVGDSNGDGRFDSADLVAAALDKYETGRPATYDEGDWNGDGVFDSRDFVFALQRGRYM